MIVTIGALTLLQLQEDMKRHLSEEGNYNEEELEQYMESHKKLMVDSLWKLNVTDIEATLSRVCQMVCSQLCPISVAPNKSQSEWKIYSLM